MARSVRTPVPLWTLLVLALALPATRTAPVAAGDPGVPGGSLGRWTGLQATSHPRALSSLAKEQLVFAARRILSVDDAVSPSTVGSDRAGSAVAASPASGRSGSPATSAPSSEAVAPAALSPLSEALSKGTVTVDAANETVTVSLAGLLSAVDLVVTQELHGFRDASRVVFHRNGTITVEDEDGSQGTSGAVSDVVGSIVERAIMLQALGAFAQGVQVPAATAAEAADAAFSAAAKVLQSAVAVPSPASLPLPSELLASATAWATERSSGIATLSPVPSGDAAASPDDASSYSPPPPPSVPTIAIGEGNEPALLSDDTDDTNDGSVTGALAAPDSLLLALAPVVEVALAPAEPSAGPAPAPAAQAPSSDSAPSLAQLLAQSDTPPGPPPAPEGGSSDGNGSPTVSIVAATVGTVAGAGVATTVALAVLSVRKRQRRRRRAARRAAREGGTDLGGSGTGTTRALLERASPAGSDASDAPGGALGALGRPLRRLLGKRVGLGDGGAGVRGAPSEDAAPGDVGGDPEAGSTANPLFAPRDVGAPPPEAEPTANPLLSSWPAGALPPAGESSDGQRPASPGSAARLGARLLHPSLATQAESLGPAGSTGDLGDGDGDGGGGEVGGPRSLDAVLFPWREPLALPWTDGRLVPEEIAIQRKPDGSPWLLGAGAYGTVYRALRDGVQPVAVKVLQGMDHPRRRDEFMREVTLLRGCRDHNIVQFLGACIRGSEAMLVTEYMELGDLWRAATLRNARGERVFSWHGRGARVALDIARGLHFLHSRRVAHLDLKSANILLSRDGTAKIADVGFARVISRSYALGGADGGCGTFAWASPEMLIGERCSPKSDMYSFGIVLWEICTGETPLRGDLRPLHVPVDCPAEVLDLFRRCTAHSPEERPSTRQLVQILSDLVETDAKRKRSGAAAARDTSADAAGAPTDAADAPADAPVRPDAADAVAPVRRDVGDADAPVRPDAADAAAEAHAGAWSMALSGAQASQLASLPPPFVATLGPADDTR